MEEMDLGFGVSKDRAVKQGRRAVPHVKTEDISSTPKELDENVIANNISPQASTRVSGWDESAPKRKNKRNLGEGLEQLEGSKPQEAEAKDNYESDSNVDDIPVIPDLEDQQEDVTATVAAAPIVAVNRVATYRELDNDLKQAAFLTLDDTIDLKILARGLMKEADLIEDDKPWDWDHLFTEVTSELGSPWEVKIKTEVDRVIIT